MPGTLMLINPANPIRRRRKTSAKRRHKRRRSGTSLFASNPANPVRRRRRHRRHNPIRARRRHNPITMHGLQAASMDALKGATGAILVNVAMKQLSPMLPVALSSGYGRYATRAGLALGIGILGKRVIGESLATKMAQGALTVLATNLVCEVAAGAGLDLSGTGFYTPAQNMSLPLARDLRPRLNGLGEYTQMPNVRTIRRAMAG